MRYLALGDSYTIGELVDRENNFPNQTVRLLQKEGIDIQLDKIIAVTGWTTDELACEISRQNPDRNYDLVTLLIGVNNQYRGRSPEEYSWQFYQLLCQAILYAKGRPEHVIVLSIPDWGLTPFNDKKDPVIVSAEIDNFNKINKEWSDTMGCRYLDITTSTRAHARMADYLCSDHLHVSAKEYAIWAEKLKNMIFPEIFPGKSI